MQNHGSDARQVKENGWRQGSILDDALIRELIAKDELSSVPGEGIWIVVSHDCDVTNGSFENEPSVDLIYAQALLDEEVDGNQTWAKNTRLLQFESTPGAEPVTYRCDVHLRAVVNRDYLARHKPSSQKLEADIIGLISNWLAKRYRRAAFADNFNERISRAASKIRSKAKKKGKWISGIYLLVSDEELSADASYDVILIATMRVADYSDLQKRTAAMELMGVIETAFAGCDGVTMKLVELRSEAEVSLDDLLRLKRWDYDDLTMRDEGPNSFQGDNR